MDKIQNLQSLMPVMVEDPHHVGAGGFLIEMTLCTAREV
jgi:hypothetical protein